MLWLAYSQKIMRSHLASDTLFDIANMCCASASKPGFVTSCNKFVRRLCRIDGACRVCSHSRHLYEPTKRGAVKVSRSTGPGKAGDA